MLPLDPSQLARVTGGAGEETAPNVTRIKKADGTEAYTARTNRAYCEDRITQLCRDANPGMLWGTNEQAAANCALKEIPKSCPQDLK